MKSMIIAISILSVAIIFCVLMLSYEPQTPDTDISYTYQPEPYTPEFELYIVTTTAGFWERVAGLKKTEAVSEEYITVTDEEGNTVTDENGAPVTEVPADFPQPVTEPEKNTSSD